ncbi:SAV_6107 family HEPN domain-containing protein [Jonesia denitrificans]|uniref:SAV-6107-like HEPN domain-containing protein n=2 Tax=Jonesia TaxID=43673 RepID=C7R3I2_JONDD|nr:hypothetical protein Jden_1062 [Jonesia denitrificans DSM 20603]ASE09952.1 hypothetical protein CEP80_13075 [Jonesia denitrificans]SQH20707.1 Uncharacterised protein [Jonesia denitrificans]
MTTRRNRHTRQQAPSLGKGALRRRDMSTLVYKALALMDDGNRLLHAARRHRDPEDAFRFIHYAALRYAGAVTVHQASRRPQRPVWDALVQDNPQCGRWVTVWEASAQVRSRLDRGDRGVITAADINQWHETCLAFREEMWTILVHQYPELTHRAHENRSRARAGTGVI